MKAINFRCSSTATDKTTEENITMDLVIFIRGTHMDFNKPSSEELAFLMPMKGSTRGADLCEVVKKAFQGLDIPI
jgi:hypothetical protein